jgi:hypothetical protein
MYDMLTIKLPSAILFCFCCIALSIIELVKAKWAHLWALTIVNDGAARDGHGGHGASIFLYFRYPKKIAINFIILMREKVILVQIKLQYLTWYCTVYCIL